MLSGENGCWLLHSLGNLTATQQIHPSGTAKTACLPVLSDYTGTPERSAVW